MPAVKGQKRRERSTSTLTCSKCSEKKDVGLFRSVGNECKKCQKDRKEKEKLRRYQIDPGYREKEAIKRRENSKKPERRLKQYALKRTPHHREMAKYRMRLRYAEEPGYRERILETNKRSRHSEDPEWRKKKNEREKRYRDSARARRKSSWDSDPLFRIKMNLYNRLNMALKCQNVNKSTSPMVLVGCTLTELKDQTVQGWNDVANKRFRIGKMAH